MKNSENRITPLERSNVKKSSLKIRFVKLFLDLTRQVQPGPKVAKSKHPLKLLKNKNIYFGTFQSEERLIYIFHARGIFTRLDGLTSRNHQNFDFFIELHGLSSRIFHILKTLLKICSQFWVRNF